jgi:hypothetical protein
MKRRPPLVLLLELEPPLGTGIEGFKDLACFAFFDQFTQLHVFALPFRILLTVLEMNDFRVVRQPFPILGLHPDVNILAVIEGREL